jgi:hypothetical protein
MRMTAHGTADVKIPTAYHRSHLSITFTITNVNTSSECALETALQVTLNANGSSFQQRPVRSNEPLNIDLHGADAGIQLIMRTINRQGDANCSVNVSVADATVYNWSIFK